MYSYEYPRPALTVDCVIFGFDQTQELRVLLIRRKHEPFQSHWALPGGFVEMDEDLDTAARRELQEETGLTDVFIEQLYTFGSPLRDPRGRVISVAYYALVNLNAHQAKAADDAEEAKWHKVFALPADLAFDHAQVMQMAIQRLQAKVRYQPIGFGLLPPQFTLSMLQKLYETILHRSLNKRNFRAKMLKMGILEPIKRQEGVAHRPAVFYQFNPQKYQQLSQSGFIFEI